MRALLFPARQMILYIGLTDTVLRHKILCGEKGT